MTLLNHNRDLEFESNPTHGRHDAYPLFVNQNLIDGLKGQADIIEGDEVVIVTDPMGPIAVQGEVSIDSN